MNSSCSRIQQLPTDQEVAVLERQWSLNCVRLNRSAVTRSLCDDGTYPYWPAIRETFLALLNDQTTRSFLLCKYQKPFPFFLYYFQSGCPLSGKRLNHVTWMVRLLCAMPSLKHEPLPLLASAYRSKLRASTRGSYCSYSYLRLERLKFTSFPNPQLKHHVLIRKTTCVTF